MTKFSSKLIALLVAAVAFTGGAQGLAPAPAAAMVNQGEECDPNYPSADCEPNGGGGGGSGGTGGQDSGDGPTVGSETIEVHDTPPSPCVASPSSCLPREAGGRAQVAQADRGPRLPRRGGRPVRVAEEDAPAARCRKENRLADSAEKRMRWFEQAQRPLVGKWRALDYDVYAVEKKVAGLRATRSFLRDDSSVQEPDLLLAGIEAELTELERDLDNLKAARNEVASNRAFDQYALLRQEWAQALGAAAACAKMRGAPGR